MTSERQAPTSNGSRKAPPKHRASRGPSPSVMSGISIGGTTGAFVAGPMGAVVGMVIGGAAGELIDRQFPSKEDGAESTA